MLKNQPFNLIYVDAFAGSVTCHPGVKYAFNDYGEFNEMRKGSVSIALDIQDKKFDRMMFIEKNHEFVASLKSIKSLTLTASG